MSDRTVRWAASAAFALFVVIGALTSSQDVGVVAVSAAVAIIAAALMQWTGWRLAVVTVIAAAALTVLCSGSSSNVGWFGLVVLAGSCVLRGGTVPGVSFSIAVIVVLVVEWTVIDWDPGWAAWVAGTIFTTVVCLMGRRQRELIDQLRVAQAGLAARTRAEERNRIARELHDVIAHSLTVSLLHVSSARLAVEEDPAEAASALAEAERLGRQSLTEVRHAVGLLREGPSASLAPMPGAAQLPTLVEGFRRAGAKVSYEVLGDSTRLSATAGLTLYRILQEALTNAARHAPGAETKARIHVGADRTVLSVHSAGEPGVASLDGVGLHGMRERAQALGGTFEAGPSAGGWIVRAVLPGEPATAALG
jgi:signal transduction histidine kinase